MALTDFDTPLSNVEAILQNALGAENEVVPQSRVEELLDRLDKALEDMVIGTATTQMDGLMSSTDKSRLDTLYADYSSALTALGVS